MGIFAAIKYAINSTLGTASFRSLDIIVRNESASLRKIISSIDSKATGMFGGTQTFTSDGTFTVPANVTKILVTACGGGQGSKYYNTHGFGGDGGDWIYRQPYSVTPLSSISITVGKGSNGLSSSGNNPGGNTIIGGLVTLVGGGVPGNIRGGLGGGTLDGDGSAGFAAGGSALDDHTGGGGSLGRGASPGRDGVLGSGGASGSAGSSGTRKGGDGVVIIEW